MSPRARAARLHLLRGGSGSRSGGCARRSRRQARLPGCAPYRQECGRADGYRHAAANPCPEFRADSRSEEHTSELQSLRHLACRFLLDDSTSLVSTLFPYTTLFRSELVPRGFIFFAVEADRGPADVLDDREDRLAFLAAHRIAKNAAEQTDIVTQRQILVRSFEQIHESHEFERCGR